MMINKFQLGGDIQQKLALDLVSNGVPQETVLELSKNKELWGQLVLIYLQEGIQGVANALQQLTKAARHGTKLQYIKSLKNQCAEDEELYYYKKGGSVKCGCKKKEEGGQVEKAQTGWKTIFKKRKENTSNNSTSSTKKPDNTIYVSRKKAEEAEKYRKEEEKKKKTYVPDKSEEGAPPKGINKGLGKNKCGGKMKKESNGSKVVKEFKAKCGAKMKKHQLGGSLNGIPFYQAGTFKSGIMTKEKADAINNREKLIAKQYFTSTPSISNIWNGIKHAYNGWIDPVSQYQTGTPTILPGRIGKLPSPKVVKYKGLNSGELGGVYLSNGAKKVSDGSKYTDIVEKTIQEDIAANRLRTPYQIENARRMRTNNAARLTDEHLLAIRANVSEELKGIKGLKDPELWRLKREELAIRNLILGYTGRVTRKLR